MRLSDKFFTSEFLRTQKQSKAYELHTSHLPLYNKVKVSQSQVKPHWFQLFTNRLTPDSHSDLLYREVNACGIYRILLKVI